MAFGDHSRRILSFIIITPVKKLPSAKKIATKARATTPYTVYMDAVAATKFPVIDDVNNSKAYKVSVDIPTGIDPDTGDIVDKCINADLIVTFHDMKKGIENFEDIVVVADIGLPK